MMGMFEKSVGVEVKARGSEDDQKRRGRRK